MLNPDRLRKLARIRWRELVAIVGEAWPVLSAIAGLSVMTAIIGFFTEHPALALPLAAFFAYYGFRLFERVQKWWRSESVYDKLQFAMTQPVVVASTGDSFSMQVRFLIRNVGPFDIYYKFDDEESRVGNILSDNPGATTTLTVSANSDAPHLLGIISDIPKNKFDRVDIKLSIRYGRSAKNLNVRWFVTASTYVPSNLAKGVNSGGYRIERSDREWIESK